MASTQEGRRVSNFYGSLESPDTKRFGGATRKEYLYQMKKRKTVAEREKLYAARPLPIVSKPPTSHFNEHPVWKWFPVQQDAFDFCGESAQDNLRIFTSEKQDGKRRFLVTTHTQFWARYRNMAGKKRHFYELIPLCRACRLYFDIEFYRQLNADLDGEEALQTFIDYVCWCLYAKFSITTTHDCVIDLDSSTDKKFSRHLIFHLDKNALFVNNVECGVFVKSICQALEDFLTEGKHSEYFPQPTEEKQAVQQPSVSELNNILVNTETGKTFLCDLAVYTRNRNFRLFLSSKYNKNVPLVVAPANTFRFKMHLTQTEKAVYKIQNQKFYRDHRQFYDTLVCPDEKSGSQVLLTLGGSQIVVKKRTKEPIEACSINPTQNGSCRSKYPKLDEFVVRHANSHVPGLRGYVRRFLQYDRSDIIVYDLDNNRWCGNIARQHRSNHVYYVVDLQARTLFQKCHDPECVGYKSQSVPVPDDVMPDDVISRCVNRDDKLGEMFAEDFSPEDLLNIDNLISDRCSDANEDLEEIFATEISVIGASSPAVNKSGLSEDVETPLKGDFNPPVVVQEDFQVFNLQVSSELDGDNICLENSLFNDEIDIL